MRSFLLHVALAVLWMLVWGHFGLYTLAAGIVIGYLLLALTGRASITHGYALRLWRLLSFVGYFVRILVIANWQVAKLVMAPSMPIHPRIIRYDVAGLTPAQIATLASAITLTPGTLAADLSADNRLLYIHCINSPRREQTVRELDELKRRLLKGVFA